MANLFTHEEFYQSFLENILKKPKPNFLTTLDNICLKSVQQDCKVVKNGIPELLLLLAKKFGHHSLKEVELLSSEELFRSCAQKKSETDLEKFGDSEDPEKVYNYLKNFFSTDATVDDIMINFQQLKVG